MSHPAYAVGLVCVCVCVYARERERFCFFISNNHSNDWTYRHFLAWKLSRDSFKIQTIWSSHFKSSKKEIQHKYCQILNIAKNFKKGADSKCTLHVNIKHQHKQTSILTFNQILLGHHKINKWIKWKKFSYKFFSRKQYKTKDIFFQKFSRISK